MIGLDPQLVDPEHGDFRLAPDSPAHGYGCQTFAPQRGAAAARSRPATSARPPHTRPRDVRTGRDVIEVRGEIAVDTLWEVDLVRVVGNLLVAPGVTLQIAPGTRVEFVDYYRLDVQGTLRASGTPAQWIVFTTDEPQNFYPNRARKGCWNGIRFIHTSATNAPSALAYCVLEYSKALADDGTEGRGGALALVDFSQLAVLNCVLRNNVAEYGGALYLDRNSSPVIAGNLVIDNHALGNASVMYAAYSTPLLAANTVIGNTIHNAQHPFIESCAVLNFLAKPHVAANIVRENDPEIVYLHSQLWSQKAWYARCNNIADYPAGNGNIDVAPRFVDADAGDFRLAPDSPCIDAGANTGLPPDLLDLDGDGNTAEPLARDLLGRHRRSDDPATPDTGEGVPPLVDQGAYEFARDGDLNCDGAVDFGDIDPFVLALSDASAYARQFPACDRDRADTNRDGLVDLGDIRAFITLLVGVGLGE